MVLLIAAAALTIDQLSKAWALTGLGPSRVIELAPGMTFQLVFNPGVAFSLGRNMGPPLAVGIIVLTLCLTTWAVVRAVRGADMIATGLMSVAVGGAAGNLWDRVTRAENGPLTGEVVDFINVDWFAIFNVADIFATLGIAGFALRFLLPNRHSGEPTSRDGAA
ncbi:signal peptidase II [Curtobacterium sp. MCLR17_031]|uniref:signal peptidase II n=1 Tax=Curtobacterium sp. MCLR17_031 TaxID=2175622 RepID=UPI0015E898D2|nr:signal peptidase II [Curtobacterium sp. MCLR17_031]WIE57997.1 signal peptidase II [Curtobacterium sp. MCLR17_031]